MVSLASQRSLQHIHLDRQSRAEYDQRPTPLSSDEQQQRYVDQQCGHAVIEHAQEEDGLHTLGQT